MRITEVNLEAINPIEAKPLDEFSEVKILVVEANVTKIHIKVNTKVTIIKAITTLGQYNNPYRGYHQGNNYGQFRGRSHGHGRANYCGRGHGRSNYRGNNNYQYHQYYGHDNDYQPEQYGPPCALCSGYNHSPKCCFKGEHDINNIMEKINISGHQSQQSGLYS